VSSFPARQISVYQSDWGADKKMFMTQWGTHADRNTPLQGLHLANFYFFLAQYNAAHEDYFAVATSSVNLALEASRNAHQGGTVYREKIVLLTPYLYSKPFRHLFSGDKRLLTASVKGPKGDGQGQTVKALAAASPDGRKFLYLLNTGPSVALGRVTFDAEALSDGLVVQIESAFGDPASPPGAATARRAASASANTFTGEKVLRDLVLEPSSLTLLILPSRARAKLEQSTH